MFRYSVFGLKVSSEIELPELYSCDFDSPDVEIRFGAVPQRIPNTEVRAGWLDMSADACLLRVPDVGRYLIEKGKTITIDAAHTTDARSSDIDIRLFVLGSSLGNLLHQRKSLPLHISAVMTPHGVIGFTGPSGAGKSTLGGWFMKQGRRALFSDDVAALHCPENPRRLFAGPRRLKLWLDAMEQLNFDVNSASKVISHKPKYQIIGDQTIEPEPLPLIAMVELARHPSPSPPTLQRLRGKAAFDVMMGSVYRPMVGDWFHSHERMVGSIASLCSKIKVYRFIRSWSLDQLSKDLDFLAEQIEVIEPRFITSEPEGVIFDG